MSLATDSNSLIFGRQLTLSGALFASSGSPSGISVRIVGLSTRTGRWVLLTEVVTGSDGRYAFRFVPREGYRFKSEVITDSSTVASASRTVTVKPGIYNVRPASATDVVVGGEKVVVGSLYSQLAGRRVKLEVAVGGAWDTVAQTYAGSAGQFGLRWTFEEEASAVRIVVPAGGGLVVASTASVALKSWPTGESIAFSNVPCFGVNALLTPTCDSARPVGIIAPTTNKSKLRTQTGGAYGATCWQSNPTALLPVCTSGSERTGALRVAFVGDSHAAGYFRALRSEFNYWNWRVDGYLGVSCRWEYVAVGHGCEPRYRQIAEAVSSGRYDLVVYTGSRYPYPDKPDEAAEITDRYVKAWQPVLDKGIPLIVMGDHPYLPADAVDCPTSAPGGKPFECTVSQIAGHRGFDPTLEASKRSPAARYVDVTRYFCRDGFCPQVVGGAIVYRDAHHITGTYGASLSSKVMWELRRAESR